MASQSNPPLLASRRDFAGRRREIVERVLRDYGEPMQKTLMRLACACRFDRAAFERVVKTFHTGLPLDAFDTIDDLSFLTNGDGGFLSMHGIMADAIREMRDGATQTATLEAPFEHYVARAALASHREVTNATVMALFEAADAKLRTFLEAFTVWLGPAVEPLRTAARYADAAVLWRQAATVTGKHFGSDHRDTAGNLNNLGALLDSRLPASTQVEGACQSAPRALALRARRMRNQPWRPTTCSCCPATASAPK
jgi:hypothetical protein